MYNMYFLLLGESRCPAEACDILLPKLTSFYDNCVAPEICYSFRVLDLPICDLS